MRDPEKSLKHLIQAARQAPVGETPAVPHGFVTRVQALAREESRGGAWMLPLAFRAFAVAGLLAAILVASNLSTVLNALDEEVAMLNDTTMVDSDPGEVG